jgi:hypothetical protein
MDLCCLIDSNERLAATDLVTMLGDLLERGARPLFPSHDTSLKLWPQKLNSMLSLYLTRASLS